MKLIDKDALMTTLAISDDCIGCKRASFIGCKGTDSDFVYACDSITDAPTIEIVTCGECKYCERESVYEQTPYGFENEVSDKYVYCTKHHDEDGEVIDVRLDDFCAWGERRER